MAFIFILRTADSSSFSLCAFGLFCHCSVCEEVRKAENGKKGSMLKVSLSSVVSLQQCKEALVYLFDKF